MKTTTYLCEVMVWSPEDQEYVVLEIHKDSSTNATFGVEASYLEQVSETVFDPYDGQPIRCADPEEGGKWTVG